MIKIKLLIILFSFSLFAQDLVKVDVDPGLFVVHIYNYHFADYGKFHHTESTLWFSKPNNINIEMEIYHYAWENYKKEKSIKLSEKQAIDEAVMRMHKAINKLAARLQLPKDGYIVQLNKRAINKYIPPKEWINFKLED